MIGFLCNSGTISEYDIKNIIENNKININEIIFFSEFDTEINYQNFPIKFVKIQNFINLEHINLKNWDWFSHIPFLDPQFFNIFPKFEDLSIWWTIDIHCYLSIRNLLKTINILDKITLDYSEIQKIYLIKFPVEFKILKKYYPKLEIFYPSRRKFSKIRSLLKKFYWKYWFYYVLYLNFNFNKTMKELSLDNSNFRFNPSKPTIFIYGQETEYRSSINSENQNQSLKDYYYENFKNEIFSNDNYNLIESFVITKKNTKKLIKIYNKEKKKFEIIFLSNLINRHYRKQWNSIKNNVSEQMRDFWEIHDSDNSFNYLGKNLSLFMKNKINEIFKTDFNFIILNYLILENFFKDKKPIVLLLINEYSIQARSAIYLSKKHKIPTIGIQHGIIYSSHIGYNQNQDIKTLYNNSFSKIPYPDFFMVGGDFFKKILLKNSIFNEKSLLPFGYLPYDNILKIRDKNDEKKLKKTLNVPNNKRIILYADNIMPMFRKFLFINPLLKILDENEEFFLIIKQHPNDPINEDSIRTKIESKYHSRLLVVKDSDIKNLIKISEITITEPSTIVFDCYMLDALVVVYSPENIFLDDLNPLNIGNFIDTDKYDQLIKSILFDQNRRSLLLEKAKKLKDEINYNTDKPSFVRLIDFINQINKRSL